LEVEGSEVKVLEIEVLEPAGHFTATFAHVFRNSAQGFRRWRKAAARPDMMHPGEQLV
jgi:hypothetical protein